MLLLTTGINCFEFKSESVCNEEALFLRGKCYVISLDSQGKANSSPLNSLAPILQITINDNQQNKRSFMSSLHNNLGRQGRHPWPHLMEEKASPEIFNDSP